MDSGGNEFENKECKIDCNRIGSGSAVCDRTAYRESSGSGGTDGRCDGTEHQGRDGL